MLKLFEFEDAPWIWWYLTFTYHDFQDKSSSLYNMQHIRPRPQNEQAQFQIPISFW